MARCFFKQFAPKGLRDCDGRIQNHHAIKQQTIKSLFRKQKPRPQAPDVELRTYKERLRDALSDTRNRLWACKRHHDLHEKSKWIPVPRSEVPDELEDFAEEYGLGYDLDRQFGVRA
jgi:hypothetical protein